MKFFQSLLGNFLIHPLETSLETSCCEAIAQTQELDFLTILANFKDLRPRQSMACLLCASLALIAELIQDWIINLQPFIYKLLRLNWLKPLISLGFKDKYKLDNSTFIYS